MICIYCGEVSINTTCVNCQNLDFYGRFKAIREKYIKAVNILTSKINILIENLGKKLALIEANNLPNQTIQRLNKEVEILKSAIEKETIELNYLINQIKFLTLTLGDRIV